MEKSTITEISKEDKIKDFIKNNNLTFSGTGSELNSECVIISGYGLHIGIDNCEELENIVAKLNPGIDFEFEEEIRKTFSYAEKNNYQNFWTKEPAKKMYKF